MSGFPSCCFVFDYLNDDQFFDLDRNNQPLFMAKIMNTTVLEGNDHITFYEGNFGQIRVNNIFVLVFIRNNFCNYKNFFKFCVRFFQNKIKREMYQQKT